MEITLRSVPDDELLRRLGELVGQSRRVEADLVAHIGEADERRLYSRLAFPSMFAYCTEGLHLSEAEAYRRITVARAARRHPVLLEMLRDGRLHLSGIATLVPLLTEHNRDTLLERATHRSKRQLEELVAEVSPRPDAPSLLRKMRESRRPMPEGLGVNAPPPRRNTESRRDGQVVADDPLVPGRVEPEAMTSLFEQRCEDRRAKLEPLSPGRYKVQFTASAQLRDKIERLTALMRSEVPDGDLAVILDRAVSEKLQRLEARRFAKTAAPRQALTSARTAASSRHIPAAVRRAVRERDGDRCRFVDDLGRRCSERHRLEFHHRHPFGMGGEHSPDNVSLLCTAHNRRLAEQDFGQRAIERHIGAERTRRMERRGRRTSRHTPSDLGGTELRALGSAGGLRGSTTLA